MARHLRWPAARIRARVHGAGRAGAPPEDALDRHPGEMSGGQRQRVALMRALMLDPELLFLDEPLAALDPLVRAELQDDLVAVFARLGKSVVLVTHDLAEAALFGDTLVLLRDGRVVQRGSLDDLVCAAGVAVRDARSCARSGPPVDGRRGSPRGDRGAAPAGRRCGGAAVGWWRSSRGARAPPPGAQLRVGSKAFTESVRAGRDRRPARARGGGPRDAPGGAGRHARSLWDALVARRDRRLPRVHRHAASRRFSAGRTPRRRGRDRPGWVRRAGRARRRHDRAARLQQHLRHRRDPRRARRRSGSRRISDLRAHPELRFGFSSEFMSRADGWPGAAAPATACRRRR